MKINQDHLYHGAALTQIAEHEQFTAINAFRKANKISRSAFKINGEIGIYLKYATKPTPSHGEYQFNFSEAHIDELRAINKRVTRTFIVLVCAGVSGICTLTFQEFLNILIRRRVAKGADEEQYFLLVSAPPRKSFRVYMNAPGRRNTMNGSPLIVPRNRFPDALFEKPK